MDRATISRTTFKKNFLKEIIMRLDFQGVFQAEMEQILPQIKPYLKSKGFNRYAEKPISSIDENDDIKSQVVYSFSAESKGYTVNLSSACIVLSIRSRGYSSFDEYAAMFCDLANIYKEHIDFFTVQRFGLRKINFCFFKDKASINRYFQSEFYNCNGSIEGFRSQLSEKRNILTDGIYNINMRYAIEEGKLASDISYKVLLDSDIYLMDQASIERMIFADKTISTINEHLFRLYVSILTDEFIDALSNDNDIDDIIQGVENND